MKGEYMTIKIIYLNGCWEYVRNVKHISCQEPWYFLELHNGSILKFDARLKLEVSR